MRVFTKVEGRAIRIGGEQHTGWLPEGFAKPVPPPLREVKMTFEITDDGEGNFLLCYHSEDQSVYGDTWHQSIEEAKKVAESSFGVRPSEWKDAS